MTDSVRSGPEPELTFKLTRAEAQALVDSIEHGDIAYGLSWRELVSREEVDARSSAIVKLEKVLDDDA